MFKVLSTFLSGLGFLILAWILPLLVPQVSPTLRVVLCITGLLALFASLALGLASRAAKEKEAEISVRMHDGNKIGQIGHRSSK